MPMMKVNPRHLQFGSSAFDNKDRLLRSVYEPWVNISSIFDASPGDSIMAQKVSPIVEETLSEFEHLLTFKSINEDLTNECSADDAKLHQAEQTLKDLQECEDDSAASLLADLLTGAAWRRREEKTLGESYGTDQQKDC